MGDVVDLQGEKQETEAKSQARGPALNQVTLLGRLTADPDLRYRPDGKPVTELRVATNERQEPEYHDVVSYDRLASAVAEYCRQGSLVLVTGRLHGQSWKAQDGSPRRRVVVIAESVQFLTRAGQQQQ
jgi:single-strand DNA-binding protein